MGVFEEAPASPGMHWQQFDRWGPVQERLVPHAPSPSAPSAHHHHHHHPSGDPEGSRCFERCGTGFMMGPGAPWYPPMPPASYCTGVEGEGDPGGHHGGAPKVGFEYHASSSLSPPLPSSLTSCGNPSTSPSHKPMTPSSMTPTSQRVVSPPSSTCSSNKMEAVAGGAPGGGVGEVAGANSKSGESPSASEDAASAGGATGVVCAGCGDKIVDRFYLMAVDQRWHSSCLKCCQCNMLLETEGTCFARDGSIYCKEDYYRLFGLKRCARCQAAIASHELVMRAKEYVFHVHCFTCVTCNGALSKGDHFGMQDHLVFCSLHYEMALNGSIPASAPVVPVPTPTSTPTPAPSAPPTSQQHQQHQQTAPSMFPLAPDCPRSQFGGPGEVTKMHFYNGSGGGQKGRPRKRKPKDLEALTANLDLNADGYLDGAYPGGPMTPNGQPQRTKRMRTSFKHHQLRTMKSYFAINHNPDAKDLKQLSQKTGLPKRVLQVWFQNARAKWRRMMLKQEGKGPEKAQESGSLAEMVPTSLNQQYGGPTTITTEEQSPQFYLDSDQA